MHIHTRAKLEELRIELERLKRLGGYYTEHIEAQIAELEKRLATERRLFNKPIKHA